MKKTWGVLVLFTAIACSGDGEDADDPGGLDGGVRVCEGVPTAGASCSTEGKRCELAGSPCGSLFTCSGGSWQEEVRCPTGSECPADAPAADASCELASPVSGSLICTYSQCGHVQATCDGESWSLRYTPASSVCRELCEDVCSRLATCGVAWAASCSAMCEEAYACPGESVDQDAAICSSRGQSLEDLECPALCAEVTESTDFPLFGKSCDGL